MPPLHAAGTEAFSYLNLSPSPRASAMGSAYVAVAQGPQTVFFNPSGLAFLKDSHLYTQTYLPPFLEESKYHNLVWARPSEWGAWALTTGIFHVGPFTRTVVDSSSADGYKEVGDFTTYDLKVSFSSAKEIKPGLAVGSTLSFMRESLADFTTHGVALDLGVLYSPSLSTQRFGLSLQQVGPDVRFQNESFHLPLLVRGGWSISQPKSSPSKLVPAESLFTVELQKILSGGEFLQSGIEIPIYPQFKLRGGYKYALQKQHLASKWLFPNGFSLGIGMNKGEWSFDYSTSSMGDLGLIHQVALDLRWRTE